MKSVKNHLSKIQSDDEVPDDEPPNNEPLDGEPPKVEPELQASV